jgi:hypothetical protein
MRISAKAGFKLCEASLQPRWMAWPYPFILPNVYVGKGDLKDRFWRMLLKKPLGVTNKKSKDRRCVCRYHVRDYIISERNDRGA